MKSGKDIMKILLKTELEKDSKDVQKLIDSLCDTTKILYEKQDLIQTIIHADNATDGDTKVLLPMIEKASKLENKAGLIVMKAVTKRADFLKKKHNELKESFEKYLRENS